MANYNHGHYVAEALESVLGQSRPAEEVLVVDDGSTDDSRAVLEGLARKHPSLKVLPNDRNRGANYSYNRALREAAGDYVRPMSADDRAAPGLFEKSMAMLERYPQAGLSTALVSYLDAQGRDLGPCPSPLVAPEARYLSPEDSLRAYLDHGSWVQTFTAIFKRSAMLDAGGYDPEVGHSSDGLLIGALSLRYGACFIPERLAYWRKLDDSFALKNALDPEASRRLIDAFVERLRRDPLFPETYVARYKRDALLNMIYETNRRREALPDWQGEVARFARELPDPTLGDRLFAALMAGGLGLGGLTPKLYGFLRQPATERLRIARRKLGL